MESSGRRRVPQIWQMPDGSAAADPGLSCSRSSRTAIG
jgi:hypothetical protein